MSSANSATSIAASRYNITPVANRLPGCCCFCKTGNGPFIDTGVYFKLYGNLYICIKDCLREMAGMADLVRVVEAETPDIYNLTREDFEEAISERVSPLLDGLSDLADYLRGASLIPLLSEDIESDGADNGDERESSDGADKPALEVVRSASSEGPDDLSSNSSDGDDEDPFDL